MQQINLFDNNFAHTKKSVGSLTSTYIYPPKEVEWIERYLKFDGPTVFTDHMIFDPVVDKVDCELKIAWLQEPPSIHPDTYSRITSVENKFDYILTFDESLLQRSKKYIKYIVGQSRVPDEEAGIHNKSKKLSLISSGKTISNGHRYRGVVSNYLLNNGVEVDLWGYAHRPFQSKLEPLKDYEFSICILNTRMNNYFTEILLDCFRLGTVPIFWGCPNIGDYFDLSGMETFSTPEDLLKVIQNLKPYDDYMEGIVNNFELCKPYIHTDDYIARIIKNL